MKLPVWTTLNIALIFVIFAFFPIHLLAAELDYLVTLKQQAQQLKLAQQKQWLALLHYAPASFSKPVSVVTDQDFFYHPHGNIDPQAELAATLAQFFLTSGTDKASAQCRFPTRFAWLQQQLHWDTGRLPHRHCIELDEWLANLAVTNITVVFPVAYLNNPASLFGHSFLRLDQRQNSSLMAWAVNYAANTNHEHGIPFALKGLFGGYLGRFSLSPYYVLLKEYADLESRDLWEYTLNLSAAEQQMLLWHLWELTAVQFDYYFVSKNCAYQVLALLEVAKPNLQLTEQFNWNAIPADTFHALMAIPGFVKSYYYRPALLTTLTAQAQLLTPEQQQIAKALSLKELQPESVIVKQHLLEQQARILTVAFQHLSYLNADKIKNQQPLDGELSYRLLNARSLLPQIAPPAINTPTTRPDQAHAGHRLQLAYGYEDMKSYLAVAGRWAYHDLYDPSAGFAQASQIEFFNTQFRYYPQSQQTHLQGIDLVNINSMPNYAQITAPFSWQVALDIQRQRFPHQQHRLIGEARLGGGLSYSNESNLLSLSALSSLVASDKFSNALAIGLGGSFHAHHDFSEFWRVGIDADIQRFLLGVSHTRYRYRMTQRLTLSAAQALVLEFNQSNEFNQAAFNAQLAWQFYF